MSSPSRFTCARPGRQVHLACDPSHVEVFPPALILDIAGLGRPRWRPSAPRPTAPSPLARPCRPAATAQRNASRSATGNGWAARKTALSCSSVSRIGAMDSRHTAESGSPQRRRAPATPRAPPAFCFWCPRPRITHPRPALRARQRRRLFGPEAMSAIVKNVPRDSGCRE
jgi:hypothetical protein